MMIRFAAAASALILLAACGEEGGGESAAPASATAWDVDYGQSTLNVAGEYGAVGFEGAFGEWSADIVFSPEDLTGSSISAEIQVASLDTGDNSRDEASRSDRWLAAGAFPTATYAADTIEAAGEGYLARGELTVAGATNPLDLIFTVDIDGETAHAVGSTEFDHHDLGITGGYDDPDTGDMFTVSFDITATRVVEAAE